MIFPAFPYRRLKRKLFLSPASLRPVLATLTAKKWDDGSFGRWGWNVLFRDDRNLELCHGNGLSGAGCLLSCSGVGGKEEKESGRLILEPTVSHPAMTATLPWFHGGFQCCKKLGVNKEEQILFSLVMLKDSSVIISSPILCLFGLILLWKQNQWYNHAHGWPQSFCFWCFSSRVRG